MEGVREGRNQCRDSQSSMSFRTACRRPSSASSFPLRSTDAGRVSCDETWDARGERTDVLVLRIQR